MKPTFGKRIAAMLLACSLVAQQPAGEATIRITVNLVQIDAVVVDSKGRHIPNLEAADFDILQDGKVQKIRSFQYVQTQPASVPAAAPKPLDRTAPPPPPIALKASEVQRTIAIVVDDLGMSWESMAFAQQALKKFVEQKVQPNDLVAIIRTGAGVGALQSFTTDKRRLLAAVQQVKWNPLGRGRINPFIDPDEEVFGESGANLEDLRDRMFAIGTVGTISYVINGLRELPGRKSVVLVSDGIRVLNREGTSDVLSTLTKLTDEANRASVVIYTIDARGLPTLQVGASERAAPQENPVQAPDRAGRRRSEYFESQNGLSLLATETGGIFYHDNNDLAGSMTEVLNDQQGYYLLGYSPDEGTFNKSYHKIQVRVKRPGLKVRSRNGFIGVPDSESRPAPKTRQAQLLSALTSPFGTAGVPLRLTTMYSHNAKQGNFITSLLHMDVKNFKFTQEADGWNKANIDVMVVTFGDNGQPVDQSDKTYTIRLKGETLRQAMQDGMIYTVHHPIKKPGAYQLRAAVRDSSTEAVGSASQFIEVPDVSKGRLSLSGLYLKSLTPEQLKRATDPQAEGPRPPDDPKANPALRTFSTGQLMAYLFQVVNAKPGSDQKPDLTMQARLFRDGQKIFEGKPIDIHPQILDPTHLLAGGQLRIGAELKPGDYVLQVQVVDRLAKPKQNTATQFMDFIVVPRASR